MTCPTHNEPLPCEKCIEDEARAYCLRYAQFAPAHILAFTVHDMIEARRIGFKDGSIALAAIAKQELEAKDEEYAERIAKFCEKKGYDTSCCYDFDDLLNLVNNQSALKVEIEFEKKEIEKDKRIAEVEETCRLIFSSEAEELIELKSKLQRAEEMIGKLKDGLETVLCNWPEDRDGMDNEILPMGVEFARQCLKDVSAIKRKHTRNLKTK